MRRRRFVFAAAVGGCTVSPPRQEFPPTSTTGPTSGVTPSTADTSAGTTDESTASVDSTSADEKLDIGPGLELGCEFVDFLFVVDNSQSMQTYQQQLADEFPNFIAAVFDALPPDIDIHVGITTTDFDANCDAPEISNNCQTTASFDEVSSHYITADETDNGGNGSQGRLFEWSDQYWLSANSSDDPATLTQWFSGAAVAAGEQGCSFEMPVAAAGWAVDPANDATNAGFIRDEGALLVVFFLTDEPDKSPEPEAVHAEQILARKAACGGAQCVFVSGLIPACIEPANQKLWQFMTLFDDEDAPPWGDVAQTTQYSTLFGSFLADGVAQACSVVPAG